MDSLSNFELYSLTVFVFVLFVSQVIVFIVSYNKREIAKKHTQIISIQHDMEQKDTEMQTLKELIKKKEQVNTNNTSVDDVKNDKKIIMDILYKTHISVDENWDFFQKQFADMYPDFILKIKNDYPNTSKTEMKVLILSKLGLDYSESAKQLGVTNQAIRTTWYRFRNKHNLQTERNAQDFVIKI